MITVQMIMCCYCHYPLRQLSVSDSGNGFHGNATLSQKLKQLRAQLIAIQPAVGHCRIEVDIVIHK